MNPCPSCGGVTPPEALRCAHCGAWRPRKSSRVFPVAIVAGVVLLAAGLYYAAYRSIRRTTYESNPEETETARHQLATEYFSADRGPVDASGESADVTREVEAFVAAQGTPERFIERIHFRRLLAEITAGGTLAIRSSREEDAYVGQLRQGFLQQFRVLPEFMRWKNVRVMGVRFHPRRPEAEAFCRIALQAGFKAKVRLWLIKEDGAWRVYDLQDFDDGMKWSGLMSAMAGLARRSDSSYIREVQSFLTEFRRILELIGSGEPIKALEVLDAMRTPRLPDVLLATLDLFRASALLALGRVEEAIAAIDRGLARSPDSPISYHVKANALFQLERYEESAALQREYLSRVGDDPDGCYGLGLALEELERMEEATAAWRRGMASDPDECDNRSSLAALALEAGRIAEAEPLLLDVLRNAPDPSEYFAAHSDALLELRAYETILKLTERASLTPDERSVRGRALRATGRLADAEEALREAVATEVEDADYYRYLHALVLGDLRRLDEALAEAAKIEWGSWKAAARAHAFAWAGRAEDARRELESLLPDDGSALLEILEEKAFEKLRPGLATLEGRAREEVRLEEEASRAYVEDDFDCLLRVSRSRLKRDPRHLEALFHEGYALARLGRPLEAIESLRRSIPRRPAAVGDLVRVLSDLGRHGEAIAYAEFGLRGNRDWITLQYARLYALAAAGRTAPALEALRAILEQAPAWRDSILKERAFARLLQHPEARAILEKYKK